MKYEKKQKDKLWPLTRPVLKILQLESKGCKTFYK